MYRKLIIVAFCATSYLTATTPLPEIQEFMNSIRNGDFNRVAELLENSSVRDYFNQNQNELYNIARNYECFGVVRIFNQQRRQHNNTSEYPTNTQNPGEDLSQRGTSHAPRRFRPYPNESIDEYAQRVQNFNNNRSRAPSESELG